MINLLTKMGANLPKKASVKRDAEGLGFSYQFPSLFSLIYVKLSSQQPFRPLYEAVRNGVCCFEDKLKETLQRESCASFHELLDKRVLKRKHYVYAAYLATLSTFPILSRVARKEEILSTILAKVALITSIKTLDNVNDKWHNLNEAKLSLKRHLEAVLTGDLKLLPGDNPAQRVENSCLVIASLVNRWLSTCNCKIGREMFKSDLQKYVEGQTLSFAQKEKSGVESQQTLDIKGYLRKVNEKAVGSIWIDLDFCQLETILGGLSSEHLESLHLIRRSIDRVFKACNIYDDVADLQEDLRNGIWNSVIYLGIDQGMISEKNMHVDKPLENETIRLADLLYLTGLEHIKKVADVEVFDIRALLAGLKILRIFSIRKKILRDKNLFDLLGFMHPHSNGTVQEYLPYV